MKRPKVSNHARLGLSLQSALRRKSDLGVFAVLGCVFCVYVHAIFVGTKHAPQSNARNVKYKPG